jgi:hypothetical protein
MSLKVLYQSARTDGANGETARQLLAQSHWFTVNAEFDPKTGDALPQALSAFLAKVAKPKPNGKTQDRLYRLTEHVRPALDRLFRTLNESPRREHAIMPVRAVRELDASSFIKLSTRPGRNIREKLAGKPYLQAVRRFQSLNLPENRLLKAFVSRLVELLKLRSDVLGEPEDELLPRIESWLLSDEARAIGNWDNLPPNNTLLAHRDYRRVWDAWRRLQSLDEDIALDLSRLDARRDTMMQWMDYGRMYREGTHLFADMPVLFDYEAFTIRTWGPEPIVRRAARRIGRSTGKRAIEQPVCLDLAEVHPRFADTIKSSQSLTETYLWQQWQNEAAVVDIALFNSDAVYLHPAATTIASPDLFLANDRISDHLLDRAARAFVGRLRDTFKNDKLIWLVPDAISAFDLDVVRRNLNARFPSAEPLPRSMAALFEQIDYARITRDGYAVIVADTVGGFACVTKIIARFDADLKTRLPETNGYYWERCPPVILSKNEDDTERRYDIATVDNSGQWYNAAFPERPPFIDPKRLKADPRIGQFAFCINVCSSPVAGGIRLHTLQASAGDIPLWRDQIPELSIKAYVNGFYRRFYLVGKNTTIRPIRGLSVQIPIAKRFPLLAGRRFYQFPLYQGESAAELRYSARLDSRAFPLSTNTQCELILTFQYGADEPYTLIFDPLDKSFPPVRATWKRAAEEIVMNAPAPGYPEPLSWDDLRRVPKPDSTETSDLLDWVLSAVDRLDRDLFVRPSQRSTGRITSPWHIDKNGRHFAFCQCSETNIEVFIHEDAFVNASRYDNFACGDVISFELHARNGKCSARNAARPDYEESVVLSIRNRLYVPFIKVWRDGRSITDSQCPVSFSKAAAERIEYLGNLVKAGDIPHAVKSELLFLLACIHKDTTEDCVRWLTDQVDSDAMRRPQAVGFALGDVSTEWQQYIFDRIASKPSNDAISVFAYAIWREQNFVERFSLCELRALLDALSQRLANIQWAIRNRPRKTAEQLELLLGLLRTRASNDPDIRLLLQPHQRITKLFAEQIDRIEELIAESHITLSSHVQINIPKPEGVRTPDLLYALRLYLTGDDSANAVHITSISDRDDDRAREGPVQHPRH